MDPDDRRTVLFTSASHGLVHTYELSIPILMTVWLAEFSVTAATLGLVVTVGYGLFGVGALPGGVLVDRIGSWTLIFACLLGMAGSFLLAGVAPSLGTLAIAIAVWGVTASVYHPAGLALLSTSVDRPGTAFGYHGIGGNVGIAFGPLATAVLLVWFDWRLVAAALAIPALVVAVYGLRVRSAISPRGNDPAIADGRGSDGPDDDRDEAGSSSAVSLSDVVSDSRALLTVGFALVLLIVTLNGLYYRAFLTFLPELLGDVLGGLIDVGSFAAGDFDVARYLYVAILSVGVGGQYLGGRLADSHRPERVLAYVLVGLAVLAAAFVPARATVPSFLAVSLLLGVALFTIQPLAQATVASYSPPETRGLSYGYTYLAIFGVGALGAGLAGAVLTWASPRELFLLLAAVAATSGTVSALLFRVGNPVDLVGR